MTTEFDSNMRFLQLPGGEATPRVGAFRRRFRVDNTTNLALAVTADERYELFLDGQLVGRGPTRGDANHWFYETYTLNLTPGEHELFAHVLCLGPLAPAAQMHVEAGFALAVIEPQDEMSWLDTKNEGWENQVLTAWEFESGARAHFPWFTGPNTLFHCEKHHLDGGWQATRENPVARFTVATPVRNLEASPLPPQRGAKEQNEGLRELGALRCVDGHVGLREFSRMQAPPEDIALFEALSRGNRIEVGAHRRFRVLFDLEDYVCAYPRLRFEGGKGARLSLEWAEALEHQDEEGRFSKGRRDAFEGLHFRGPQGDTVCPDGREFSFSPLWWRCGRFLKLEIETRDDSLTIHSLQLEETGYPLEITGRFECDSPDFQAILPPSIRALEMCCHESFMDCPYYEQLQYVGDTRLQALLMFVLSPDDRLVRQALKLFDSSRDASGLTRSRYPCGIPHTIPSFSLWWIWMLHDFAFWRGDAELQRQLLPGARAIAESFLLGVNDAGLLQAPEGWNFLDWVEGWPHGVPGTPRRVDGAGEITSSLQWHLVGTLERLAQLESEPELVARWRRHAQHLATTAEAHFWDEEKSAFREAGHDASRSEHAQVLAILSGHLSPGKQTALGQTLLQDTELKRASIYFSHYVFEALRALGLANEIWPRLAEWDALRTLDLKTTPERFSPDTRSDCHAWGAHPAFHAYATFAGVRPLDVGFHTIEIAPQFGPLTHIHSVMPHPRGQIVLDLQREGTTLLGEVVLPQNTRHIFKWHGHNAVTVKTQ